MLTITGADGEIIQQFSSGSREDPRPPTTAGMSRFLWNMRYPRAQMPPAAGALTEKLSTLSSVVGAADARPTESMYAVFEDLSERFEVQRNRLNQVIE
jgi:hypothetical protein